MKPLTHDEAIDAICGCARTVTVLSYQEAIEGYLELRHLSVDQMRKSPEHQTYADSVMEAVTNTLVGIVIAFATWQLVAALFGIPMPILRNLEITGIFTVVSIVRQLILRRLFNGRSVWTAIKGALS